MLETICASDADARLQQRRAEDQGAEPGHRDPGELLQRVSSCSPAPCSSSASGRRASIPVLGGAASSYKFVKEFPDAAAVHHGLQSLVRSDATPRRSKLKKKVEATGPVLHLRGVHELFDRAAGGRCPGARRLPPTAPSSPPRWRRRPSPVTSCRMARPSSSTARTKAPRRPTPRCIGNDIQVIYPDCLRVGEGRVPDAGLIRHRRRAQVRRRRRKVHERVLRRHPGSGGSERH